MPGKIGGASFSVLLLDGFNILAAKVKEFSYKIIVPLERSDGLGDAWDEHTPTGQRHAEIKQGGAFFDTTANGMHAALKAAPLTNRILCWAPAENTIGAIHVGCEGVAVVSYEVLNPGKVLTKANAEYQVTGQMDDDGEILLAHGAQTADWTTAPGSSVQAWTFQRVVPITSNSIANPTVVTTPVAHGLTTGDLILIADVATSDPTINGERAVTVIDPTTFSVPVNVTTGGTGGTFTRTNSSFGGVGYLSVSAASGFTNSVIKIRDSADNVTFADLVTFADNVVAPFAERVEVAGVVDRYLSVSGDVTGSGSISPFVGFKRNQS